MSIQHQAITLYNESHSAQWRVIPYPAEVEGSSVPATLLVGLNMNDTNGIIARYTVIFLGFAAAVVVFGAATTQLLVTSTFSPLRDVEATAARFAAGDYSQRLGGATPNTEVGRLNRSLNTMLARIDRAFADRARTVEQMRRFVGDACHELRTPLVSVRGYAELYRMGALQEPEDVAQAMDRIEREAIRMGGLVEDLLELARLDEARPLELAPVDLLPIAQDAALDALGLGARPARDGHRAGARDRVGGRGAASTDPSETPVAAPRPSSSGCTGVHRRRGPARSRSRAPRSRGCVGVAPRAESSTAADPLPEVVPLPDVGPIVLAEENKIRQVVTNLMGNAMRFTPDDSPIEIAVEVDREGGFGADLDRRPRRGHPARRCARRSSSGSGAPTPRAPATPAARASGSRSSRASSPTTTGTSRWSRRRAAARRSASAFLSSCPTTAAPSPPRLRPRRAEEGARAVRSLAGMTHISGRQRSRRRATGAVPARP